MTDLTLKIQPTANPDIIKLEANRPLVKGSYEFKNIDEAKNAPLAKELFYLPFVKTVYISSNFIALKRFPIVEWKEVQEEVAQQVLVYLQSGKDILLGEAGKPMGEAITVYTETTPNPTVMKFVANKRLVPTVIEYKSIEEAAEAPMAATLLTRFPFIEEVFFDDNYISLTKKGMEEWEMIAADLRDYIRKYLSEGRPIINPSEIKRRRSSSALALYGYYRRNITTNRGYHRTICKTRCSIRWRQHTIYFLQPRHPSRRSTLTRGLQWLSVIYSNLKKRH